MRVRVGVLLMFVALAAFIGATAPATAGESGELGIADEAENIDSGGTAMLYVAVKLSTILIVLIGALAFHQNLFVSIVLVVAVILFVGKGIPALVDSTALAEGATLSEADRRPVITPEE